MARFRHIPARFFAVKLLERDGCVTDIPEFAPVHSEVEAQITHLKQRHSIDSGTYLAVCRYKLLGDACSEAITLLPNRRDDITDRIDAVVTHKYFGLPIFFGVLYLMFFVTFRCAEPFMDWIEAGFGFLSRQILNFWPEAVLPWLRELIANGVVQGVGGVLVFLPNILLFLALALLEDSGYMSRAAFVMDGIMRRFGLQGRSFVPLVLGFGCNVPAIMATRCISSERDRKITIMVLPLMSCGARLPIYALMIPAFFSEALRAPVMFLIYLTGVAVALVAAFLMKATLFRGDGEVYMMELPPYLVPALRGLLLHMWDRGKMYMHKAGTLILGASVLLFIANTFPRPPEGATEEQKLEYSISGRVGKALEPAFRPIGFDWKMVTSSIGALAAKEIFVSQLGILYAAGEDEAGQASLREALKKNYTPLQGVCVMLFCLLSIPCLATLAVIRRELNSWKYAAFEAVGLFLLAYIGTGMVYQLGKLFGVGVGAA